MSELRYTSTDHLSGCFVSVDNRVHGLFIAKRALPRTANAAKWVRPPDRQPARP